MEFIFHIHAYPVDRLLPQTAEALEKRVELLSRERYPGLWQFADRQRERNPARKEHRLLSWLCLLLGIFLFVPGLMQPGELTMPLLAGALGILTGIFGLWSRRRRKGRSRRGRRYIRAAKKLLRGKDGLSPEQQLTVCLSPKGIALAEAGTVAQSVPFDRIETVIEAPDLFLVVYARQVTLLQKSDLQGGSVEALCGMLREAGCRYGVCPAQTT